MSTSLAPEASLIEETAQAHWIQRPALFALLLAGGMAVMIFGSNYFEIFPTNRNLTYHTLIAIALLATVLLMKRDARFQPYWRLGFAFFTAAMVNLVTRALGGGSQAVLQWLDVSAASSEGYAILKIHDVILAVIPILVLTWLSGASLGSVYLKHGKVRWGAGVGALVWLNMASAAFLFFVTRFNSGQALVAALLWGMVFSLANGFMEELWVRGIFLKHLEPHLGVHGSVLLTSIIFALMHGGAMYLVPAAVPFIVVNTLALGLGCGYVMMKTDSIWGAVLMHAGADLFLFIALLASS